MVITEDVRAIFLDARTLQSAAVERLGQGDIRDAAEKAWGATKRATDALVLARNRGATGISRGDGYGTEAVVESRRSRPAGRPEAPILHPPGPTPRPLLPHGPCDPLN